ncbi:unnamed protein product, partial [Gadus morhua 'NCC']
HVPGLLTPPEPPDYRKGPVGPVGTGNGARPGEKNNFNERISAMTNSMCMFFRPPPLQEKSQERPPAQPKQESENVTRRGSNPDPSPLPAPPGSP